MAEKKKVYLIEMNLDGPWKPSVMIATYPKQIEAMVEKFIKTKASCATMANIRYKRMSDAEQVLTMIDDGIRLFEREDTNE